MESKRAAVVLPVAALLLVAAFLVLRETGDGDPPSDVTRSGQGSREPTLRGCGTHPVGEPEPASSTGPGTSDGECESWTVKGRVIDLEQRPVEGVPIVVGPGEVVAMSGVDGTFTWRTNHQSVGLAPGKEWTCGLALATPEKATVEMQVVRLLTLAGRVLDATGRPVEGVSGTGTHVYVSATGVVGEMIWAVDELTFGPTDADGRFVLDLAASTFALTLEVAQGNTFAAEEIDFPFQREVVLRLRPRLRIHGYVVDASGRHVRPEGTFVARPVDPVQPIITVDSFEEEIYDIVEFDDESEPVKASPPPFSLTVGGPGPWFVHFDPTDAALACSEPLLVCAPAEGVRLVCPPGIAIRGQVLDARFSRFHANWIPAPGPDGYARPRSSTPVEDDGRFRLEGLAAGPGRLFVRCRGDDRYGLVEYVRSPLEGVLIRLVKGVALTGRVVGLKPRSQRSHGAWLWILAEDRGLRATATVKDDGAFRIRGLPPGCYDLSWRWYGPWSNCSERWVPFEDAVNVDPEAGEVTLPAPP